MPGFIPDDFWIQGSNVTLGTNGVDDGAANADYPSLKNDVSFFVLPSLLVSDTQPALTYDSTHVEIPLRQLATATTHKVTVPFPQELIRTFVPAAGTTDGAGVAATSKGILVKTMKLFYRVNVANITSITGLIAYKAFATEATLGDMTAPAVTVSGGTLTAAANVYTLLLTVTTPFLLTTVGSAIWGVVTLVTAGSSSVADLFGAEWTVAYGLY